MFVLDKHCYDWYWDCGLSIHDRALSVVVKNPTVADLHGPDSRFGIGVHPRRSGMRRDATLWFWRWEAFYWNFFRGFQINPCLHFDGDPWATSAPRLKTPSRAIPSRQICHVPVLHIRIVHAPSSCEV